jgi:hypothetical protein
MKLSSEMGGTAVDRFRSEICRCGPVPTLPLAINVAVQIVLCGASNNVMEESPCCANTAAEMSLDHWQSGYFDKCFQATHTYIEDRTQVDKFHSRVSKELHMCEHFGRQRYAVRPLCDFRGRY